MSKKITIILAAIFLILSTGLSYFLFAQNAKIEEKKFLANPDAGPKTEECPINGKLMTKGQRALWEKRRPMGIMVENHTEARPQSGLSNADVIYEAVAEGGITRFLNIFYCDDAELIGPVRSARIYFLKMLEGYGSYPLYSHVGGANTPGPADALGEIGELGWNNYNDLNQFSVPFPVYYRDYERLPGVATEHTMYASTQKLWDFAKKDRDLTEKDKKGKSWDESFTPWKFKDDAKAADRGDVSAVSFGFWAQFESDYGVKWAFDREANVYNRTNGGKPHLDKNSGKQLTTKNIVIALVDESPANDGYEGGHLLYDLKGTGDALIFQDGKVTKGSWNKKDDTSMMRFKDKSGEEISLVRGNTWVEILPIGNKVTY